MALEGRVRCRCWEDGKATPPPVDVYLDDYDDSLDTTLPWADASRWEAQNALHEWKASCCVHEDMHYCFVHMPSFTEICEFRQALEEIDSQGFTALWAALPKGHEGIVSPEQCAAGLDELRRFEASPPFGRRWGLVDTSSGETVFKKLCRESYLGARDVSRSRRGLIKRYTSYSFALDEEGLHIHQRDERRFLGWSWMAASPLVFSSSHFLQEIRQGRIRLQDKTTGASLGLPESPGIMHWRGGYETLHENNAENSSMDLEVRSLAVGPEDFAFVTKCLRKLFTASVETCNPVAWQ